MKEKADTSLIIKWLFLIVPIIFLIAYMRHFAESGPLGSVGIGIVLVVSISSFLIAGQMGLMRGRSAVATVMLIGLFGGYFLVFNLKNAKPINNSKFEEVYQATGQK